jgi:type VI secretion system protein ImpG
MSDTLLPHYNRELAAVRGLAAEFAEAHPKIAGRLRLAPDAVDDPHVARLLEGLAFLSARVQHRLDDEFPELTDALLGVLYPHYLAPVPSCAMAQLLPRADLTVPLRLPAGLAVDSEQVRGETCRFRTAWPLTLWPVAIETVALSGLPLAAPANSRAPGAVAVLRIVLRTLSPEASFAALRLDRLRLCLRAPASVSLPLLELLGAHVLSVACAGGPADPAAVVLPPAALQPAGFAPEDALLPWPARSFSGFRLLTEYFALPEKFLAFDLDGLSAAARGFGSRMEVFVYLDRAMPELERAVDAGTLALGCTPIVNLFPQRCEPIALAHTETEYRVVPDLRRERVLEVWQVERVRESRPDGSVRAWRPFYRLARPEQDDPAGASYHAVRRAAPASLGGTETFLAPSDPGFDPHAPADGVLSVDALCCNRDLPADLPFGGGHPVLRLAEPDAGVARITWLTAPTPTLRAPLREAGCWRLVSHLSLGHLSVVDGPDGAAALREVLRLYDLRDSAESRAAIEALLAVSAKPAAARLPGRPGAFCRGLDVRLEFDARVWRSSGLYLLAAVLERFLALHATVNSFVRAEAVLRGQTGRAAAWPARTGARVLL